MSQHEGKQGSQMLRQDLKGVWSRMRNLNLAQLWLFPRVYVGWVWLNVGWALLQSRAWLDDGAALLTAWSPAAENESWIHGGPGWSGGTTALLVETVGTEWIARVTAIGMTLAGIALLLGLASGVAAVTGVLLSAHVMVAGSTAIDPLILAIATGIVLSWKTAGLVGLDRWFLPLMAKPLRSAVVSRGSQAKAHRPTASLEVTK